VEEQKTWFARTDSKNLLKHRGQITKQVCSFPPRFVKLAVVRFIKLGPPSSKISYQLREPRERICWFLQSKGDPQSDRFFAMEAVKAVAERDFGLVVLAQVGKPPKTGSSITKRARPRMCQPSRHRPRSTRETHPDEQDTTSPHVRQQPFFDS